MSSSQELLWKSYVVVRFWLHLVWLRFNLFLKQPSFIIHARSATFHKIAVVGDGFAEGVGDRVDAFTAAGVARHLQALLDKKRSIDFKQRWQVLNWGSARSRSADWSAPEGARFARAFGDRRHRAVADADVVVVLVGTTDVLARARARFVGGASGDAAALLAEDDDAFAARVSRDVARLCDALRLLGKRVLLVDLPTEAAVLARERGAIRRVNRALRAYADGTVAERDAARDAAPADAPAHALPTVVELVSQNEGQLAAAQLQPEVRGFDGVHLCSKGYRLLSEALRKAITPHMVAVEWQTWKGMLSKPPK